MSKCKCENGHWGLHDPGCEDRPSLAAEQPTMAEGGVSGTDEVYVNDLVFKKLPKSQLRPLLTSPISSIPVATPVNFGDVVITKEGYGIFSAPNVAVVPKRGAISTWSDARLDFLSKQQISQLVSVKAAVLGLVAEGIRVEAVIDGQSFVFLWGEWKVKWDVHPDRGEGRCEGWRFV